MSTYIINVDIACRHPYKIVVWDVETSYIIEYSHNSLPSDPLTSHNPPVTQIRKPCTIYPLKSDWGCFENPEIRMCVTSNLQIIYEYLQVFTSNVCLYMTCFQTHTIYYACDFLHYSSVCAKLSACMWCVSVWLCKCVVVCVTHVVFLFDKWQIDKCTLCTLKSICVMCI